MLLLLLATVRCAYFIIEQPMSSLMPYFPYLLFVQRVIKPFLGWETCALPRPQRS